MQNNVDPITLFPQYAQVFTDVAISLSPAGKDVDVVTGGWDSERT
jgi:hypothetical protein